jgi:outer membrane scaffolding protein for murein synthesis (MipA/OmpV family)
MNFPAFASCRLTAAAAFLTVSGAALAENAADIRPSLPEAQAVAPANIIIPSEKPDSLEPGAFTLAATSAQGQDDGGSGGLRFSLPKPVFDETWASVGVGAGLVPSYGGSDDYIVFPLPLIVGRVGGVGISPNGPGFALDLFSPAPGLGANKMRFFGGPAFRIRNDRAQQIEDEVVERAEDLDWAVEVGAQAGVSFPGVFNPLDTVTLTTQLRWDVAGAHDGMLIEPSIGYSRPFGPGVRLQANIGLQFVDDSFADYYYTVTPAQGAATGLPLFTADGGLNNVSSLAIVNFDLDGNLLNGGFNLYTVLGYTRFLGDGADTPFTDIRGDANQFTGGIGVAYTF